ncbi:MAG: hypothetical protein SYR96_06465 [Actinomycetota bacterium]|nr:hypothetical protein [Actinomycetota bacterium]
MTVPNIGPEHFDQGDAFGVELRMGNPAPLCRDEPNMDDASAATARTAGVSHRFGDVRHALSRPNARSVHVWSASDEGNPDARN